MLTNKEKRTKFKRLFMTRLGSFERCTRDQELADLQEEGECQIINIKYESTREDLIKFVMNEWDKLNGG